MTWVKIDDHFDEHPKFVAAGPEAGWMFMRGLAYCNRHETDGHIPEAIVARIGSDFAPDKRRELAATLVEVGLWHGPGHGCPRCPDPADGWQVHDYPDYQPTKAQKEADRAEARTRMARARSVKQSHSSRRVPAEQEPCSEHVRSEHHPNSGDVRGEFGKSSLNPVPVPDPLRVDDDGARAREAPDPEAVARDAAHALLQTDLAGWHGLKLVRDKMADYAAEMGWPVVLEAMRRTVTGSPGRTWNYCEGILRRWTAAGVRDPTDILALDQQHEARKEAATAKNGRALDRPKHDPSTYYVTGTKEREPP